MTYATRADLERLWGLEFLSDLLPQDVTLDTALDEALGHAGDEIDAHLSARYTLPLQSPPAVLTMPAADIAIYRLANRHEALTETLTDRYKAAVDLLKRIADGKAGLGADEPKVAAGEPGSSGDGASFTAPARLFGRRRG